MNHNDEKREHKHERKHEHGHGRKHKHGHDHILTLANARPGTTCRILKVGGEGELRRRLLDMGLTPNTQVLVRKVAPMGDPIELYLRSYELTIRKDDAKKILVEEVSQ